jgi:hypothetical protein
LSAQVGRLRKVRAPQGRLPEKVPGAGDGEDSATEMMTADGSVLDSSVLCTGKGATVR